jgi:hypothetical protein
MKSKFVVSSAAQALKLSEILTRWGKQDAALAGSGPGDED